jgi:aminoglycoside 3-N-acetyltransferase I
MAMAFRIERITAQRAGLVDGLLEMFAQAFEDPASYSARRPDAAYVQRVLGLDHVVALAALVGERVVGGLVAYELHKLEQARSEMYLYDLAVLEAHRRQGVARALIAELGRIAAARGAWVMYVQADHGDDPAIALYTQLGQREDVMHFDIAVARAAPSA